MPLWFFVMKCSVYKCTLEIQINVKFSKRLFRFFFLWNFDYDLMKMSATITKCLKRVHAQYFEIVSFYFTRNCIVLITSSLIMSIIFIWLQIRFVLPVIILRFFFFFFTKGCETRAISSHYVNYLWLFLCFVICVFLFFLFIFRNSLFIYDYRLIY